MPFGGAIGEFSEKCCPYDLTSLESAERERVESWNSTVSRCLTFLLADLGNLGSNHARQQYDKIAES